MGRFDGQVAVVTGAGSGIGRAVARTLCAEGASVLAVDRAAEGLAATAAQAGPGTVRTLVADVSEPGTAARAIETAREAGPVRLLVGAAGVLDRTEFLDTADETWARLLAVNVTAYAAFTREAAKEMRAHGQGGAVVLVASITGHVSSRQVAYSTSKAAVLGMVRSLAPVLAEDGIRVNSVSPGVVRTGMNDARLSDDAARAHEIAGIPRGRIGLPADIADAVSFLLSPQADYITGTDLVVDGGFRHFRA